MRLVEVGKEMKKTQPLATKKTPANLSQLGVEAKKRVSTYL